MQLQEFLLSKGFAYTPKLDGSFERFEINGKENNGWLVGSIYSAHFGNWATGEKYQWEDSAYIESLSPEELLAFKEEQTKQKELREKEKLLTQEKAADTAKKIWYAPLLINVLAHPYIDKKKIKPYGIKTHPRTGDLVIPIYNQGKLVSLQFISPDGSKRFLPGGKLSGSYFRIGNPAAETTNNTFYLCEGYATGASIFEATGSPVIVAFNAGNLPKVAEYLKSKNLPQVIVCADNDFKTMGNPGFTKAKEAATILGALVVCPEFTIDEAEAGATDFNDAVNIYGIERVRSMLEESNKKHFGEKETSTTKEVKPQTQHARIKDFPMHSIPWKTKKGEEKPSKPSQSAVAQHLFETYGHRLMKEKREVFEWVGTHWVELEPIFFKSLIRTAGLVAVGQGATDKDLNAYYNMFMDTITCVPEGQSFYTQFPLVCNFLDGTLRVVDGALNFTEHSPQDLLTWVLPYRYKDARPPNPLFQEWLKNTFQGDTEKLKAVAQIGGACLIPVFPRLVFFHGPAGTGKSTFAKLCARFIGKDNFAACPPEEMHGFMMESLIGKRVNIVTDISGGRVDSGVFKRLQDNTEILVNRKGRLAVRASIPSLHLFCGNNLPKGIDGESEAMDRRASIVEMDNKLALGAMRFDFENEIMAAGQGAILDFFEQGLRDLIQDGKFFNPESGKKLLQEWKLENNQVGQFLAAIERKEINGILEEKEAKIKQKDLWDAFEYFLGRHSPNVSRIAFYKEVRKKYPTVIVNGYDHFVGVKSSGGAS